MHPDPTFRWEDREAMRALVAEQSFGVLCVEGPRVLHVPAVWLDEATLGLHVARKNEAAAHLDDARALYTALGDHGYVSPDWYGLDDDQVPTWNYVSVELLGRLRRMTRDALVDQIDRLAAHNEARLAKPAWTRAKMDPKKFEAMLGGIVGYRLEIEEWRGTRKLGQNKPAHARLGAAAGVEVAGNPGLARRMAST